MSSSVRKIQNSGFTYEHPMQRSLEFLDSLGPDQSPDVKLAINRQ